MKKSKKYLNHLALSHKYVTSVFLNERIDIEDDEEFFELLKLEGESFRTNESFGKIGTNEFLMRSFLQTPEAIERIIIWQAEMNLGDSELSLKAQEKLTKVGSTLALKNKEGRTRSAKKKQENLLLLRGEFLEKIKGAGISKYRNEAAKKIKLKEMFNPHLIDKLDYIPKTNAALANMIAAKVFGYTPSTVERYIKGAAKAHQ